VICEQNEYGYIRFLHDRFGTDTVRFELYKRTVPYLDSIPSEPELFIGFSQHRANTQGPIANFSFKLNLLRPENGFLSRYHSSITFHGNRTFTTSRAGSILKKDMACWPIIGLTISGC
jgi:hypothetical protein